jgi:hypothetical protein
LIELKEIEATMAEPRIIDFEMRMLITGKCPWCKEICNGPHECSGVEEVLNKAVTAAKPVITDEVEKARLND